MSRHFSHTDTIWAAWPALAAVAIHVRGITADAPLPAAAVAAWHDRARARLAAQAEGEFPEIQAWRRAFSAMGLKPTQYRCAAESLLRRFRKDGALPALHPLVDACNAASLAFAVPVAVFDLARISGPLVVRQAHGDERYLGFGGEEEQPAAGEVVFADAEGHAHARRWCHRQSARSAIQPGTAEALIVAETLHAGGADSLVQLQQALATVLAGLGATVVAAAALTREAPRLVLAQA